MDPLIAAAQRAIEALEESIAYRDVPDWSPSIERRREAIRALQQAMVASWSPPGWRLVPEVPTREMHRAHDDGWRAVDPCWCPLPRVTERVWRDMLQVVPAVAPRMLGVDRVAPEASPSRPAEARVIVRRITASLGRLG